MGRRTVRELCFVSRYSGQTVDVLIQETSFSPNVRPSAANRSSALVIVTTLWWISRFATRWLYLVNFHCSSRTPSDASAPPPTLAETDKADSKSVQFRKVAEPGGGALASETIET